MGQHHRILGTRHGAARVGRDISRRRFIGGSSAGVLAAVLASCTGGGQSSEENAAAGGESSGPGGPLQWWDQFRPLTEMFERDLFGPYMEEHPDVTIERRQMDAPDLGQALQVGRRSSQLPDVHSVAGLGSSPAALVSEGWFQPIGSHADFEGSPVADQIFDGIHRFDGEIYSFAPFSGRRHEAAPWLNTELLAEADVDPEQSPATWDDFRAAARRVQDGTGDGVHGVLIPTQDPIYLDALVHRLATAAGAPGPGAIDWATGDYIHDSQPYLDAVEFLVSLQADGVVHPASASMGPRDARARWAAGEAAIYPWGPWFIGGLLVEEPEAVERGVGVWHVPTPETTRNFVYSSPAPGVFWVSSESDQPELAADLLLQMTTREFQAKLAAAMDQPPALLDVVAEADVHPTYAQNVSFFEEDVRIGPVPEVATPGVWRVLAEMRDIHPNLGEIVQAVLTGSTDDVAGDLRRYKDELSAERERALEVVQGEGVEVDLDAWVFSNWDPATDYDQQAYAER
ncbi:ABC transporter substrate-binding protein [Phytoactinopolyspora halotolerans]|uniref:Carbohydrate ABC transporter substrate-binding protein n=1 Tax=Phytoactinopolyspora halotolerans TaxID=1981512 RepID=A0A6L9SHC1_9ACTN|nr:ABC transporter substrate-binding protein [Phytoactinopolyspora halotolerans]NEE03822.1 carbohydrate ABC transporter substrate-binding protein [Phytoactinopolyspora halotolerans]